MKRQTGRKGIFLVNRDMNGQFYDPKYETIFTKLAHGKSHSSFFRPGHDSYAGIYIGKEGRNLSSKRKSMASREIRETDYASREYMAKEDAAMIISLMDERRPSLIA